MSNETFQQEFARRIAHVPASFEIQDQSTACLLKEMGFPITGQSVSVERVAQALKQEPRLAELWLERGHDQRFAGGWGLKQDGGHYCVHNFSDGTSLWFDDRWHSCAEFVVRYVKFIGEVLERAR